MSSGKTQQLLKQDQICLCLLGGVSELKNLNQQKDSYLQIDIFTLAPRKINAKLNLV